MKLKKLTLIGFKSFADKITIDFDCEIIGVVGPNGCGKSNIVDAFRWVMGEQSAKSLRGDKMHDVLFAGSDSRKPINYAEVSITLNDIQNELPIDYDEITITRRLYRDGESEYLINRQQVRLKDIQDLFLGSGIGKKAFSILEQGKLDQIIHLSPAERRVIFDEAAGIGRFLQRKKETQRKLQQVSENYQRVKDIHAEVEKQTRLLKKQAEQAADFQQKQKELSELERALLISKWQTLQSKGKNFEEQARDLSEQISEKQSTILSIEEELAASKKLLFEDEQKSKVEQKRLYHIQTASQVYATEIEQQNQRIEEMRTREQKIDLELREIEKKRKDHCNAIDDKEASLCQLKTRKETLEDVLKKKKESRTEVEVTLTSLRGELKEQQKKHLELIQRKGRIENELSQKQLRLEAHEERLKEKKSVEKESAKKKKSVSELLQQIDGFKDEIEICENALYAIQESVSKAKAAETQLMRDLAEAVANEKILISLREELSGGAKQLLKEMKSPKIQKLSDLFLPSETYIGALQQYADALVVETNKELEEVLAFAEKQNISDFAILSLESIENKLEKHFLENVENAKELKKAFTLAPAVVGKDLFVDHRQVVFKFKLGKNNTFLREAEIKELSKSIKRLKVEENQLKSAFEGFLEKKNEQEKKRNDLLQERRKVEMTLVQENFALQRALEDIKKLEKSEEDLVLEQKSIKSLKIEFEEVSVESEMLSKAVVKQEKDVEKWSEKLRETSVKWESEQQQFQKIFSEWQKMRHELEFFEAKEKESRSYEKKIQQERTELNQQIQNALKWISEREIESKKHVKELESLKSSTQQTEEQLALSKNKFENLESERNQERDELEELEKELHVLEVKRAKELSIYESVEDELVNRLGVSLDEAVGADCKIENLAKAEEHIRHLRVAVERTGAVNMMAIEEYEEQKERFSHIDKQLDDLDEAKKDLEKIIVKLDSESRKIFKTTFEEIRKNFHKNFKILFHGGEADLKFTESEDVLEAGVEIVAKPPGKQMRSISLLSGGEKCLTALALLFSIFEVRPAPFCILDEVDAPLDDTNVGRFTNVLRQFTPTTQFIIVTHNKKTMAIADRLVGVSMEEKGVSKLLSLSFEQNRSQALI